MVLRLYALAVRNQWEASVVFSVEDGSLASVKMNQWQIAQT